MNGWQVFVEIAGRPPVELRPGESIVGRSRTAQVQVPDSTVSRQHARLLCGALGEVTVEDLGSSNGTIVNGARVEGRHKLADGDRLLVGDVELRVRIVAPVAPSEATVRMVLPPLGAPPAVPLPPPVPPSAAPSPLSLPLQTAPPPAIAAPPPIAPPAVTPTPMAPPPIPSAPPPIAPLQVAPPPIAPPPIAAPAAVPRYTVPIASPPSSPLVAPPPPAPIRPPAPLPPPVAPPARPEAQPARPAAPAVSPRTGAARGAELPSVTVIDRIPIPEPTPEVLRAAKLARATPAGFWIRAVALLVDGALVGIVSAMFGAMAFFLPFPEIVRLGLVYVVSGTLALAYPLVFWATQGATPGKKLLGLTIVTANSKPGGGIGWATAILRSVGYFLSGALLGLGFVLAAFTSQKQGLHDLIASTRVVRVR